MSARPLAAAAIVLVALPGCGGAKKDPHRAFVKQLDAICKSDNAKLARLTQATNPTEVPAYVAKAVPIVQDESRRLRRLAVPADQKANIAAAQRILARQVAVARQMAALASTGDTAGINRVVDQNKDLHSSAQRLAKQMGSKECAK